MRVYTFTLPKFVSGVVRKCLVAFQKDEKSKTTATASNRNKKKKREKTPG